MQLSLMVLFFQVEVKVKDQKGMQAYSFILGKSGALGGRGALQMIQFAWSHPVDANYGSEVKIPYCRSKFKIR
jgi:hypothetical protein